jgi:hypothetical protein
MKGRKEGRAALELEFVFERRKLQLHGKDP